ncbi:MAG: TRAP transporter small permease [Deltaproteobacteria bacterium]|nr:TRAP transporter small permease [Deltaproteobacteria bacterium]
MLSRIEKMLSETEEIIIFLSIFSSLIVIFVNIVLRYLFAKGFVFSEEYARYSMVLLVYIGVSQAIKKNSMIRVDIISSFIPKARFSLDLIANIFSLIAAIILIWFGLKFTIWQYSTGQKSIAMELPMWIAFAIVPLGGSLMFMRYTISTIGMIKKASRKA